MVMDAPNRADIAFPGMDEEETYQFHFRQHWIRLLKPILHVIAWMVGFIVALFSGLPLIEEDTMRRLILVILSFMFLAANGEFLVRFYNYFLYVIVVTDRKLHRFKRTLITMDEHQTIDLWVVQDIDKSKRGLIQNIFGFGTLSLEAQYSALKIHFTPRVTEKHGHLLHLREQARQVTAPPPEEPAAPTAAVPQTVEDT